MAYPCGATTGHICLGPGTSTRGNKECDNAVDINAKYYLDSNLIRNGNVYATQYNFRMIHGGTLIEAKEAWRQKTGKGWLTPSQIGSVDADLDAVIAEAEKAEAEAAATPGFNSNPTLVQFVLKQVAEVKRRAGQERWKRELRREDGMACVVSGVKEALEASHLNYPGEPLSLRGVTLRRDLAWLFDYSDAKLTVRDGGTIFWDYPGHEFHGKTLNLTTEKSQAIAAELATHRPVQKVAA